MCGQENYIYFTQQYAAIKSKIMSLTLNKQVEQLCKQELRTEKEHRKMKPPGSTTDNFSLVNHSP